MADIFLSYSRADKPRVVPLVAALEAQGWSVWWDTALSPGEEYDNVTVAELESCRAVVVVWTPVSVASRWVRGEARVGADRGVLMPVRFENAQLPIDVRAIHTTDLDEWSGDPQSPAFQKLQQSLSTMLGKGAGAASPRAASQAARLAVCVLPFANMSGDIEQEYFSDGISEDIITDLSKVSALSVVSRNSAFSFKGKNVDLKQVSRQLNVSHVLEGSVRKSGNRVRITAQLIEAVVDSHIWAERYDRDLSDIFALQDEISEAIVAALKLKLLPEEKKAIEKRGTTNPEAYKLFLMARQANVAGNAGNVRKKETIVDLCRRATEIDPNYARAWALMANAQLTLRLYFGAGGDAGLAAAAHALAHDPNLAEAHAAMARVLMLNARHDEALAEIETALRLDPESYEVNGAAARLHFAMRRTSDAIRYFEIAAALMEADYLSLGQLIGCYQAIGDAEAARDAARRTLGRIEKILAGDPDNGSAMSFGAVALATLGEGARAKEWMARAKLLDPDNLSMYHKFACTLILLGEFEPALDMLDLASQKIYEGSLSWWTADPDLDPIRELPRFKAMMAAVEARLAKA